MFVTAEPIAYEKIADQKFAPLPNGHFNFSFNADLTVWLKVTLRNGSDTAVEKLLAIDNPLLETVTFYDSRGHPTQAGLMERSRSIYLHPVFNVHLTPQGVTTCYIEVRSSTTMLSGGVTLHDETSYMLRDREQQMNIVLFAGLLAGLLIYALLLYLYTRDRSYLLYALYLATLLFHQLTYIGFLPLYAPAWFSAIDNNIVVPKIAAMIMTAALFAQDFLKSREIPFIYKGYRAFIIILLVQIPLFGTPWFYYPEITILTGLFFIVFNLGAGLYMYSRGNKQARFFIVGWVVLIVGFFLLIIDALGLITIMYHFPNLILWLTVLEALFLLLAFVDKLSILRQQKDAYETKLITELELRNRIIEAEVDEQTQTLKSLYRELHHRVKNNLQIILSIIRLQSDRLESEALREPFIHLENRIRSIAKTHELLYQNNALEIIDMREYVESLCDDIGTSLGSGTLRFHCNIDTDLALREAVYVGLIINELVSNAIKYAATAHTIHIALKRDEKGACHLHVSDDGTGYKSRDIAPDALGLKLVTTLVQDQLGGTITALTQNGSRYDIRFQT